MAPFAGASTPRPARNGQELGRQSLQRPVAVTEMLFEAAQGTKELWLILGPLISTFLTSPAMLSAVESSPFSPAALRRPTG
jgi:hypothetical protein